MTSPHRESVIKIGRQESLRELAVGGLPRDTADIFRSLQSIFQEADTDNTGKLGIVKVNSCIDKAKCKDFTPEMIKVAIDHGDTDGTRDFIAWSRVIESLSQQLTLTLDNENITIAKQNLAKEGRGTLADVLQTRQNPDGTIGLSQLDQALSGFPFGLSTDQIKSVAGSMGIKIEGDTCSVKRILDKFCPGIDEDLITLIRGKIMDMHNKSLNAAFQAFNKGGSQYVTKDQLTAGLEGLGLEQLKEKDIEQIVRLADVDGSGKIEYDEFTVIFGAEEKHKKMRQENFLKLQAQADKSKKGETPSKAVKQMDLMDIEYAIAESIREKGQSLFQVFKTMDRNGDGHLELEELIEGFAELNIRVNKEDVAGILKAADKDENDVVDYGEFFDRYKSFISSASTLEEAQEQIVLALKAHFTGLVDAFKALDKEVHGGTAKTKLTTNELIRGLYSIKMCFDKPLMNKLIKLADSDNDNVINYADFIRMLGDAASSMRDQDGKAPGPAALGSEGSDGSFTRKASTVAPAFLKQTSSFKGSFKGPQVTEQTKEIEEEIRQILKGKFDTIVTAFRTFDKDNDGKVSREEMREGLSKLGLGLTDYQIRAIISRADADNSGEIDYNEFRELFETGRKAEAKREEKDKENQALQAKMLKAEERAAKVKIGVPKVEVRSSVRDHFWRSLQDLYSNMYEAFAFIKGRNDGKHADLISQKEFVDGLERLDLLLTLQKQTLNEDAIVKLLLHYENLPLVKKKEILILSGICSDEKARRILNKLTAAMERRDTSNEPDAKAQVTQGMFGNGQAEALFQSMNESETGFLHQGEFVSALSKWYSSGKKPHAPDPNKEGQPSPMKSGLDASRTSTSRQSPIREGSMSRILTGPSGPSTRPVSTDRPNARQQTDEMMESIRRTEAHLMKQKMNAMKNSEERLRQRHKELDQREAEMKAQEMVLKERESVLVRREQEIEQSKMDVELKKTDLDKLKGDLHKKLVEVEQRAQWLSQQRDTVEKRSAALKEQDQRIAALQEKSAQSGSAGTNTSFDVDKMAEMYKASLEQKKQAYINSQRPGSAKDSLRGRRGTRRIGSSNRGANPAKEIASSIEKEREEFGGQMGRIDALLSKLGAPS